MTPSADDERLRALDAALESAPDDVELHFERARALDRLGRRQDALAAYVTTLGFDPQHFGASTDLGIMLVNANAADEAFALFERTAVAHPGNPAAHTNFAFILLKAGEITRARSHYRRALELDPERAEARRGLATTAAQLGEALPEGLRNAADAVVSLPYRGTGGGIPLLLLCSLGAGNIATDPFLDDRTFAVTKLIVELFPLAAPLPPHRLAFNGIGDADEGARALADAGVLLAATAAPVITPPARIVPTGRAEVARRLAGVDGVITARIERLARAALIAPDGAHRLTACGFVFPLLVRSPGFHNGDHFTLVIAPDDLAAAVEHLPGDELYVMQFIDTRDAAGAYRKYRAMIVGGRLYPLHVAVAHQWKVHYYSADMTESEAHRAVDRAFLEDMSAVLGPAAMRALERVAEVLNLDYGGIDFGIDAAGRVVVFEANATMTVPPPPADERWTYRRAAVERICAAACTMLVARAG